MSRKKNYNKTNTYRRRPQVSGKQKNTPIAWLLGGIVIGLVIPGFIWLKSQPSTHSEKQVEEVKLSQNNVLTSPPTQQKTKKPSHKNKEITKQNEHYEFYNLLSSQEDNTPPFKENEAGAQETSQFALEIATFTTYDNADKLKAELILLGIDNIKISKTEKTHHDATYKVIAGPFPSRNEATKIQQQLKENSIESALIVG